mgnify:FL=1
MEHLITAQRICTHDIAYLLTTHPHILSLSETLSLSEPLFCVCVCEQVKTEVMGHEPLQLQASAANIVST